VKLLPCLETYGNRSLKLEINTNHDYLQRQESERANFFSIFFPSYRFTYVHLAHIEYSKGKLVCFLGDNKSKYVSNYIALSLFSLYPTELLAYHISIGLRYWPMIELKILKHMQKCLQQSSTTTFTRII
jgi:hypothetical protein